MAKKKTRADGRLEKAKTYDGKLVHFYGKTAAEIKKKMEAFEEERRKKAEAGPLFEDVATEWWEKQQKNIKVGAVRAYKGSYNAALDEFSGYRMKEITPALVALWGEKYKAAGYAGKTASNARSVLSCIFKFWCVRDGEVYNPVPITDLPRGMKKTEREPPTEEQLAIVKAHPEGFGLCAWLFMYTGCRLGEVLALQWRDVDFEKNRISISKEVAWINNQPIVQAPKTANGVRTVPLLSPLRAVLEPLQGAGDAYILGGEKPLTGCAYKRRWAYYCKDFGMAHYVLHTRKNKHRGKEYTTTIKDWTADVTAHQFRHEYASMLYEAGIGELEAQKLMGHADITTTRRVYTHIRERQLQSAGDALEKFIAGKKEEQ